MAIDQNLLGVRFQGDVAQGEMVLPITGKQLSKRFLSPLVLFAGKAGPYDGEKSFNESKISLKVAITKDPIVRFQEFDVKQPRTGTTTAISALAATTLAVDSTIAPFLRDFDVLHFPIQKINVRIVAGGGTTSLTIQRLAGVKTVVGSLTPAGVTANADIAIPNAATFVKLSRAVSNLSSTLQERPYNAVEERVATTQISRSDQTYSRRRLVQEKTDKAKQTTREQRKLQELFYIMEDAEYNAFFGKMTYDSKGRVNTATNSFSTAALDKDKYTTSDGIFNVIESYAPANVLTPVASLGQANANLTIALLSAYKKKIDKEVGNIEHIHFVCADIFDKIGKVGNELTGINYNIPFADKNSKDDATGRHVKTVSTQFGPMSFMYHPVLDTVGSTDLILSVATDRIQMIVLEGGELKWVPNSEHNDLDGESGYYIMDAGLLIAYASEHYILEGIA